MQMKALKLKRTFKKNKELPDDVFLASIYADTEADANLIFFFNLFRWGEAVAGSMLIGRLMVTEGYGSPPSLAPGQDDGSGWLTVRKYHLGVAGDTFIEPVKLTKAMS